MRKNSEKKQESDGALSCQTSRYLLLNFLLQKKINI